MSRQKLQLILQPRTTARTLPDSMLGQRGPRISRVRAALQALLLSLVLFAPTAWADDNAAQIFAPGAAVPTANLRHLLLTNATHAGPRIVAVGDYGYVVYSEDNGQSWHAAATPRRALLTAVSFADAEHGWAVGHGGLIIASSDGGLSWHEQRYAPDEEKPLLGVYFRDAQHGIAIGAYGLYLETSDGGVSWQERAIINDDRHLNAITGFAPHRLAIVGESGTLLLSDDDGATWAPRDTPYRGSYFGVLGLSDDTLLIFGLRGQTYRSSDGGMNWDAVDGAGPVTLLGGGAGAAGLVALAGNAGTLRVSNDGGRHFAAMGAGSATAFATALPVDQTHLLLFGEAGVTHVTLGQDGTAAHQP